MFRSFSKARKPAKATHAEQLLARAEALIYRAFLQFAQQIREADIEAILETGDYAALDTLFELPIERFAAAWNSAFVDIGTREANAIELTQKARAKGTVTGTFNPGDPEAARLMQAASLNLIRNLTNQQRRATRRALARGLRQGLGTADLAELVRNSIGLDENRQRQLEIFEDALRGMRAEDMEQPEATRPPVLSDKQIRQRVKRKADQLLRHRAEVIARTESLRITAQARENALRQSIRAVGQSEQLVGVEWIAVDDSRTRDRHRERNGARRRLGDAFAPGIYKPGDGPPEESLNCRCSLLYEFFDSEDELNRWLAAGS